MSTGYIPLFQSLITGTLCGQWPDIGLWTIVLSMSDANGVVDVTPMFLAKVTGLPLAEVSACMKRFCELDPYSRTNTAGGARLIPIDEYRDWGWKIVNHAMYREKARKKMQQIEATASGRDADRKRLDRKPSPPSDVRRCPASPAESSADRLSDSDSDSDSDADKDKDTKIKRKNHDRRAAHADVPPEFLTMQAMYPKRAGGQRWADARKHINARLHEGSTWTQILDGTQRYADYCRGTRKERTEMVQQAATFVGENKGFEEAWALPLSKAEVIIEQNLNVSLAWLREREAIKDAKDGGDADAQAS